MDILTAQPGAEFPANDHETRHLRLALEQIEAERLETQLKKHGILRRQPFFAVAYRKWALLAAAAVCFLVLAVVFLVPSQPDFQQLASVQLTEAISDYNPTTRSAPETGAVFLGKQAFARHEFAVANREFDQALLEIAGTENPQLEQIYFYKGLSLMQLDDLSGAADSFKKCAATGGGIYQKDATWLLALVFLKMGDPKSAVPELKKTAAVRHWTKAAVAQKMLEQLGK